MNDNSLDLDNNLPWSTEHTGAIFSVPENPLLNIPQTTSAFTEPFNELDELLIEATPDQQVTENFAVMAMGTITVNGSMVQLILVLIIKQ